ncbi:hypothetical protein Cgig2_012996 [Carnegiea gigantea]|uniref:Uncharacterized protein n=1 Tax=Carnegiea gigantea TaxID=171969 RepID=A0A9Q1K9T7_9CARY|nr:hypothetical protein Cgig2_012996 [Carnegiea gigantea]
MGSPCLLMTDEMALYVLGNFEWYRREVVLPPCLLPSNYEELYSDFVLAEAKEYAQDYEVPELPQVVFLAMLLNNVVKLDVPRRRMIEVMESALKELRWSTFQGQDLGDLLIGSTQQLRGGGELRVRQPNLLSSDGNYRDLRLSFTLPDAKEVARDFNTPKIVLATFYAMRLLKAYRELREKTTVVERERRPIMFPNFLNTEQATEYESSTLQPSLLPENHHGFCPNFDLLVAMRYAHNSRIPKMIAQRCCGTRTLEQDRDGLRDVSPAGVELAVIETWLMSSSCSSSGKVPERSAGPQVEGLHPQFPSHLTLIDGRVVVHIPPKNQSREPKKIPYVVPIFEPRTPSWSSCEYSSTPSILNIEKDVEIDVAVDRMVDFQERRMAKTKTTPWLRSPDELLAEGTAEAPVLSQREKQIAQEGSYLRREATLGKSRFKKLWLRGWGLCTLGHPGWAEHSRPKPKSCELPKETTPLDDEAATPDEEGYAAEAAEGRDRDEDPDV